MEADMYYRLLKEKFPSKEAVLTEIINLDAINHLPKGTEHYLSDLHGQYDAFDYLLRNGSGTIRRKVTESFSFFCWALALGLVIGGAVTLGLFLHFDRRMRMIQGGILASDLDFLNQPIDLAYLQVLGKMKEDYDDQVLHLTQKTHETKQVVQVWSHQIKVPLAALSLMAQTGQLSTDQVASQLKRLDHYLANLLHYLKVADQVSDFRFEEVEVRRLVIQLVKDYRTEFLQKEIGVTVEGTWQVRTDAKWLSYALGQVLDNAVKYTPSGGKIFIRLDQGVEIMDSGIGILPEDIPRLFDQGFTGYNGRQHQKATGFGLYLTKRILDQLEMDIEVTSQVDQGTKVRIQKKQA